MARKPVIAIIGAGKLGVTLAQRSIKAGYTTYVAGSGDPKKIALSLRILAPGAHATTTEQAMQRADIIILAIPLHKYRTLPKQPAAGKIIIDAMNYWWEVDGEDSHLADLTASTSELVQEYFSDSSVVKAFSHIGYHHLHDEAKSKGANARIGMVVASDTQKDASLVAKVVDDLGYEPVVIHPLSSGKCLEPGTPLFGAHVGADKISEILNG